MFKQMLKYFWRQMRICLITFDKEINSFLGLLKIVHGKKLLIMKFSNVIQVFISGYQFIYLITQFKSVSYSSSKRSSREKVAKKNLSIEEEIKVIIKYWVRILNIKLGWIQDFDRIIVKYVEHIYFITNSKYLFIIFCPSFKLLKTFTGHTDWIGGIEFSPFSVGRYLCSASGDNTICLWDIEVSKALHFFNGHTNPVKCVDISPLQSNDNYKNDNNKCNSIGVIGGNGYTICSGSYDKTIRVWDIETNQTNDCIQRT
ncbi:WD-40 repeat protein [Reticulomyxa filosa]|uniref:WD-40 repeat protein n=1 Tax=Reticulomyxa filosa TaxID=46433 RepID=X6M1A9_RETFI|nr:WD-40 repeat protein [Reticulomyxa filosa]|eukprot:ETO07918.1 WD-40 repeat protein [Reticulomyxa filosa]